MKLIETTTTQQHIRKLEEFSDTENRAIAAAISVLNNSYNYLWSLPDNELVSVLQELLNTGRVV
jgi:galactose-1-phosphate uridylyltransferase